jgi:hypothetical protein
MKLPLLMSLCLISLAACVVSCKKKGPAEKLGESLDQVSEDMKDVIQPKGPGEKAGEKVDKMLGK